MNGSSSVVVVVVEGGAVEGLREHEIPIRE